MVTPVMGMVSQHGWWNGCRRGIAAGAVVLIFVLGLLAISPSLHERLHDGADATGASDQCAVVLLATGVCVAVPVVAPLPQAESRLEFVAATWAPLHLTSPRYLLRPERGPPHV